MAPRIAAPGSSEYRGNMSNGSLPTLGIPSGDQRQSNGHHTLVLRNRLTGLVADGQRCCRMVDKAFLLHFGVETEDVDNGQAVVDLLASGTTFNLIILDILLPVLNGFETTRRIRAMGVRSKIIGMTAILRERDRQAFLDAGVDEVIEKPLQPETLARILMELDGQL